MPEASASPSGLGLGLAVAGLVCAILGLLCYLPDAIAAIILGSLSVARVQRSPEPRPGTGLARTARALGILGAVVFAIGFRAARSSHSRWRAW